MLKKFDYDKMPVVDIVNEILIDSSKRGASDIHFDPQEKFMKIRIRIDGELIDYTEVPNDIKKNLVTRVKILSEMNITESRLPQDGAIKGTIEGVNLDLRVSALPTNLGEKIVIRIMDYSMSIKGIDNLGFSEANLKRVLHMISVPNGIILVTGATGTGKSTTVYSILQRLNKEDTNIITVEDPIEMNIEGVNQVQTNSEIGLTFATALRSILRQDPNIIMVGEIRDTETARIAVRASITGHLVLSTIHTNNSLNTIERLLDMDVERYLLSSALTGIISQKLARKLCPHCRKLRPANDYEKDLFKRVLGKNVTELYTTEGCEECSNGFKGRIAIHEVLLINQDIKDAISNNVRKDDLRQLVYRNDVTTLLQDGLEKVLEGQTTFEEILKLIELDDEDLRGGHGLENAINETNISKVANKEEIVQKEEKKKEKKKENIKINDDDNDVIIPENEKENINEQLENDNIKDNYDVNQYTEEKVNEEIDLPKFKKNLNINQQMKIDIPEPEPESISINNQTDLQSKEEPEIKRRSTNLESFLAEAQQLLAKQQKPIKENNIQHEKPIRDKKVDEEETDSFEDYGLSDTINFINEYKRGLKRYNEQDK